MLPFSHARLSLTQDCRARMERSPLLPATPDHTPRGRHPLAALDITHACHANPPRTLLPPAILPGMIAGRAFRWTGGRRDETRCGARQQQQQQQQQRRGSYFLRGDQHGGALSPAGHLPPHRPLTVGMSFSSPLRPSNLTIFFPLLRQPRAQSISLFICNRSQRRSCLATTRRHDASAEQSRAEQSAGLERRISNSSSTTSRKGDGAHPPRAGRGERPGLVDEQVRQSTFQL